MIFIKWFYIPGIIDDHDRQRAAFARLTIHQSAGNVRKKEVKGMMRKYGKVI